MGGHGFREGTACRLPRRGPESSCSKSFWDLPLVEGPRRQVHPKTTTFCLVLGFTPSRQPSKTHQSQNDFEQLQSTTLSGRSSAKECQVALLFATATCRSALPECLMLFRKPRSKTFGERCALQGLPEGGVVSPNAAKSASLVTNVPSTLFYEGYFHQAILRKAIIEAQAGLQRDLLVLRPGEARLALLQGRHPCGTGQGLRGVRLPCITISQLKIEPAFGCVSYICYLCFDSNSCKRRIASAYPCSAALRYHFSASL